MRHALDVNAWLRHPPTVEAARPAQCARCGAGARPAGGPLVIHGHGLRDRQVRGPLVVDGPPTVIAISARRYECQKCAAVMTVVPRDVLPGLLYAAGAIAMAVALFGVGGKSMRAVRVAVSPWPHIEDSTGWPSLRRWVTRCTSLWRSVRAMPESWTSRQRAERIATTLAAHAPPMGSIVAAAFAGAAHAR